MRIAGQAVNISRGGVGLYLSEEWCGQLQREMMGLKHAEIGCSQTGIGLGASGGCSSHLESSTVMLLCHVYLMASDTSYGDRSGEQG